jgi:hypothetical protein
VTELRAPFPYFGGKSSVAELIWLRFGAVKQYIEPFCGSAAVLLAAPDRASLEVINDVNAYIANFWRCVKYQPAETWEWQDYPVSHVDLYGRHRWLTEPARHAELVAALTDPEWPGDAQIAGWWVWGQCCWIGSGWCDESRSDPARGQRGHGSPSTRSREDPDDAGNAGMGLQAQGLGKIPHASNAGIGLQAQGLGKIPHASDAGRGRASPWRLGAYEWIQRLSERLERVRVVHGTWNRCLNRHYGGDAAAYLFDPPYRAYEKLYSTNSPVADAVAEWCRENADARIALCGHIGDYDLPGWDAVQWEREGNTYGGGGTKDRECIWFSPACLKPEKPRQTSLFDRTEAA